MLNKEHTCHRHNPEFNQSIHFNQLEQRLESLSPQDKSLVLNIWSLYEQSSSSLRPLVLDGLLFYSCLPQLSQLSTSTQSLLKIDFIRCLPVEISHRILQYLDAQSLCHCAQVSSIWNKLSNDDIIWHRMCTQHIDKKCGTCGWGLPLMYTHQRKRKHIPNQDEKSNKKLKTSQDSDCHVTSRELHESQDFQKRPWKEIYAERLVVERAWRNKQFTEKDFVGHSEAVMCLQYDDQSSTLVTGSMDNTVRVWNTDTGNCIAILKGHSRCVRDVQFDQVKIISGSMDGTIRIWNSKTYECIRTLQGQPSGIVSIHFYDKLLAAGSVDGTIKVWDLSAGRVFTLPDGHRNWVNCVQIYSKRILFSCSDDCSVKIWDLESSVPLQTFQGHLGPIQDFQILYNQRSDKEKSSSSNPNLPTGKLLTASLDNSLKLWDLGTGTCIQTLFGHAEGIWSTCADSLRMISGSQDKSIVVWDAESGKSVYSLEGHAGPVNCCQLFDTGIYSGDETGLVKLWDFMPFDFPFQKK